MKYLGHPEATLTTMWVTARHLTSAGPATEDALLTALRPPRLTVGEGLALKSSLSIGVDLGVFTRGEEATPQFRATEALADKAEWFDQFDGFARIARRLVMSQAGRPPDERCDVAVGIAWLLSRDWRRAQDPVSREDGAPGRAVATAEQLVPFVRWCRELGFGRPSPTGSRDGVMADPTGAIRRDIRAASPRRHSAREFVDVLSSTIPTGPRHPLVELAPTGEDRPEDLEVFTAVAFALKRLEGEGRIRTEVADDARERIIFRFPGPTDPYITVTHVEVMG